MKNKKHHLVISKLNKIRGCLCLKAKLMTAKLSQVKLKISSLLSSSYWIWAFYWLLSNSWLCLLNVFVADLSIVEGHTCNSPVPYLFHRQLLVCGLVKGSHPSSVCVRGPCHLFKKKEKYKDPDQTVTGREWSFLLWVKVHIL